MFYLLFSTEAHNLAELGKKENFGNRNFIEGIYPVGDCSCIVGFRYKKFSNVLHVAKQLRLQFRRKKMTFNFRQLFEREVERKIQEEYHKHDKQRSMVIKISCGDEWIEFHLN